MFTIGTIDSLEARERIELVLRVARSYYLDNRTQAQIAQDIGYSRPTVSRLLAEARERGIVTVHIGHPLERIEKIEQELADHYDLKHVRVADTLGGSPASQAVPAAGASLLTELAAPDCLITVSNGRSVAATVHALAVQDWPKSVVTQMLGTLSPTNAVTDSPEIGRQLAERLGGTFNPLTVPLVLSSVELARAMRSEEQIRAALTLGGRADIALVGVGAIEDGRSGHIFDSYITPSVRRELIEKGAVGHICGHHFDVHGRHVRSSLCERTISIDPDRLRRIEHVIGVAWGSSKTKAIKACLHSGLITDLVTDAATAEALLAG